MNIYFYILSPYPYGMAASKRIECYCKGLNTAGDKCSVVICHKLYDRRAGDDDRLPSIGTFNGVDYSYIIGKYKAKNKLRRGLDYYFLDIFRSSIYALKNLKRGDVVHCYFYNIFFHFLLIAVARLKGVVIMREVCEYPYVFGRQSIKNRLFRWIELNILFRAYDAFIPISISLVSLVNQYKKSEAKVLRIPILVDAEGYGDVYDTNSFLLEPFILHTGTMHEQKDGISGILRAFASSLIEIPADVNLIFTGPHAKRPNDYGKLIDQLGINNRVIMKGHVSSLEISQLQKAATLTIINKLDNIQNLNCFPTKLGEMLLSETPVITTTIGDANLYLVDGESAYIVEPCDEDGLKSKIIQAFKNKEERFRIAKEGRKVALREFNPVVQGKKISNFIHQL